MDFIKTSSLRALIELTFQRNWNGLIWMSRKGVTTKRVETVQTALSRNSAQPRSPAGRGTHVPRSAKTVSVRLKSRPSPNHSADHASRPGKLKPAVGLATTGHAKASRPCNSPHVPRTNAPSDPGSNASRPAERFHRPNIYPPTKPADRESIRPRPFRLGHEPDCPADRPARPSQRRGRPEALFEAQFHIFKPGLTLSRL
ncbi:unnamed protein product [Microthlaspi erraticum]|uniref:Uncharacterized protein n=1 Tax=Microthlaspi erraticum TaxID=1685480 RepID=A0A6D2JM51_9BRAS|nr:unnamed protein product [Microthlaspi erraticum]